MSDIFQLSYIWSVHRNPGSKHDDEVMYGSGRSSDPVHSGTTGGVSGQGSHLGGSGGATNQPSSNPDPTDVTSGYSGNSTGTGQDSNLTGNETPSPNVAGKFDDRASTASIKSGVTGYPHPASGLIGSSVAGDPLDTDKPLPHPPASGSTSGNTDAGPPYSNLATTADPRVDSDLDGPKAFGRGATGGGLTASSLPDRSVGR